MLTTISEEEMEEYDIFNELVDSCEELSADQQRVLFEERLILLRDRYAPPSDGNRACPRTSCLMKVDYEAGNESYEATISNICKGGLFIRTSSQFPLGQELTLTPPHPEDETSIEFTCSVVRNTDEGIGVKFENLNFYTEYLIQSIMERLQEKKDAPS